MTKKPPKIKHHIFIAVRCVSTTTRCVLWDVYITSILSMVMTMQSVPKKMPTKMFFDDLCSVNVDPGVQLFGMKI